MARTAQNGRPNPSPYQWRQREYSDHQGDPVIRSKVSRAQSFDAPEGKEKYTIQIYGKTPIQPADFVLPHGDGKLGLEFEGNRQLIIWKQC
ncbi:unnamed protein product [Penicillium discolor]